MRNWGCALLCLAVGTGGPSAAALAQTNEQWEALRREMVASCVTGAGVREQRVVDAMLETPRHLFVPSKSRRLAYFDMAIPIGDGQTISPPFIVAYMTERLEVQPTDRVLEIGTGSGYQAAVLSPLAAEVYTIEIVERLARRAEATLAANGYRNVKTKAGDGYAGWPEFAPFDKIIVTCSPETIPQALIDQLKEGGRLVIPLGERFQQSLDLFVKKSGKLERQRLESTFFVPMTGEAERRRTRTGDEPFSGLVNGGFEAVDEQQKPDGWYYVRQASALALSDAREGERVLRLENREPGRHAQALQALGLDGRRAGRLTVRLWLRTKDVEPGQTSQQLPQLRISFYDENRAEVGHRRLGPWSGSARWKQEELAFDVPPKTRLAVLMLGMFGAVGEVCFDSLSMDIGAQ